MIIPSAMTGDYIQIQFILDCIYTNATVPNYSKFGVQQNLTIQELVNSNVETLVKIGQAIRKIIDNDASEFSSKAKPVEISGLKAEKWIEFIKKTISQKEKDQERKELEREVRAIESQLEGMKSPTQKKKALEVRLKELKSSN